MYTDYIRTDSLKLKQINQLLAMLKRVEEKKHKSLLRIRKII